MTRYLCLGGPRNGEVVGVNRTTGPIILRYPDSDSDSGADQTVYVFQRLSLFGRIVDVLVYASFAGHDTAMDDAAWDLLVTSVVKETHADQGAGMNPNRR